MRKRFVYMSLLLGFLSFCSFCDLEKCKSSCAVKKIVVAQHETPRSVDITNFFLFN